MTHLKNILWCLLISYLLHIHKIIELFYVSSLIDFNINITKLILGLLICILIMQRLENNYREEIVDWVHVNV